MTPSAREILPALPRSGTALPHSQSETVWRETPTFAASSSCVSPSERRVAAMLSARDAAMVPSFRGALCADSYYSYDSYR